MNTNQKARALMLRHDKMVRNRQQSLLSRAAREIGLDVNKTEYYENLKAAPLSGFAAEYGRHGGSPS